MALIQARVPAKIDNWVKRQAKKAGLSKAAWLRNHLIAMQAQDKKTDPIAAAHQQGDISTSEASWLRHQQDAHDESVKQHEESIKLKQQSLDEESE